MKTYTAVEQFDPATESGKIKCFLGGGITNCPDWQSEVIAYLKTFDEQHNGALSNLVVFNPRRENFPIDDPTASVEQISWEFRHLSMSDIFSMYFCGGDVIQPICLYELGRNVATQMVQYADSYDKHIVVSSDPTYCRLQDVLTQLALAFKDQDKFTKVMHVSTSIQQHAELLIPRYLELDAMHKTNNKIK